MSFTIRNARIPFTPGIWDILLEGGRIVDIQSASGELGGSDVLDAEGGIVCPGFVDSHIHLDKVYTANSLDWTPVQLEPNTKDTHSIIPTVRSIKEGFAEEDILERGRRALVESLKHGTTAHRVFVDVDSVVGLRCLNAAIKLKREFGGLIDVQVVAFPQEGLVGKPENVELLYKAAELGADVVGGIPWYENSADDASQHLDKVISVAKSLDKDIHIVADDTDDPLSTNILSFISKCLREGLKDRCSASQCRGALDSPNEAYVERVVKLAKLVGLSVVENPQTSLILSGGGSTHPFKRGITRIIEFASAGVNVAAGQDDIQDAYYPYGRGSMVEVGFIMIHAARIATSDGLRLIYNMITHNGAKMMRLMDYGVGKECEANLLIFAEKSIHEVFKNMALPKHVLRRGTPIVTNTTETRFYLPQQPS
jgi:cytosine deaminase